MLYFHDGDELIITPFSTINVLNYFLLYGRKDTTQVIRKLKRTGNTKIKISNGQAIQRSKDQRTK
jgi:hypothetical protein